MTAGAPEPEVPAGSQRLAILLAMAMFVLVVDTSLMNVSIAAVVEDLDTTVSGVQCAIALEALVSAAFILIGSKVGDLIGRKRAFVLGLLGYAIGALAMALSQGLTAIIVFWAIIGGLGASLLLPAMQSLIHGNFEGAAQKKAYGLVGAAAAIAAAVGPLLGGFLTTSCRGASGSCCEVVVIADRPLEPQADPATCRTPGPRDVDVVGAVLSAVGMGGVVIGILVWQEGGESVGVADRRSASSRSARSPAGSCGASARASRRCSTPASSSTTSSGSGISSQMLQNIALGGTMIALPIYLQMVLEYSALRDRPDARAAVADDVRDGADRRQASRPATARRASSAPAAVLLTLGMALLIPIVPRADSGWALVVPLRSPAAGLGLLVSQLNNYTLSPISEERVSEAAGVNSAAGSFGLSFGLAFAGAIMLATLSIAFTQKAQDSTVLPPAAQEQVAACARGRRRGDEQHPARGAARRPAAGDPGRDPPHQHRRAAARAAGRAAGPAPRRPPRAAQLVPDDAAARPGASESAEMALV